MKLGGIALKSLGSPHRVLGFAVLSIHLEYDEGHFKASFDPARNLTIVFNGMGGILRERAARDPHAQSQKSVQDIVCERHNSVLINVIGSSECLTDIRNSGLLATLQKWISLAKEEVVFADQLLDSVSKILNDERTVCSELPVMMNANTEGMDHRFSSSVVDMTLNPERAKNEVIIFLVYCVRKEMN